MSGAEHLTTNRSPEIDVAYGKGEGSAMEKLFMKEGKKINRGKH